MVDSLVAGYLQRIVNLPSSVVLFPVYPMVARQLLLGTVLLILSPRGSKDLKVQTAADMWTNNLFIFMKGTLSTFRISGSKFEKFEKSTVTVFRQGPIYCVCNMLYDVFVHTGCNCKVSEVLWCPGAILVPVACL